MDGHKEVEQKPTFASVEKPNLFLEGMAIKVRQLSPLEVKKIFGDRPPAERVLESNSKKEYIFGEKEGIFVQEKLFPDDSAFEINGRIYGVRLKGSGKHDTTSLKAFVYQLDKAAEKMSNIAEGYERKTFPIEIFGGHGMFASNEHITRIGEEHLKELSESFKHGDYNTAGEIQSIFFHELIHHFRGDIYGAIKPSSKSNESMPILGDFLYNPKRKEFVDLFNNPESHEVYQELSVSAFERIRTGKGLPGYRSHDKDWVNISKILLWEYKQLHPEFSIPESLLGQMKLVSRLPDLYENIPQEQRDAILKKYIKLPDEDIEKVATGRGRELKLKF
ncbi:hypothetical protein H0N98_03225 [Candidatus Micrarchaeota archaeon]|nr:hypothetical protein [Candidatus Micrarchaeota archaeon]